MNVIEFDRWNPSVDDPRELEYAGQRTAQEVFEELKHRLEGQGYLPDEYFEMRDGWKDGREIPQDADLFCTVDYGGSEGAYVDVHLKWCDKEQKKSVTEGFIVGKTLGSRGNDLDRMFLTASAITKAFHGDHATYPPRMNADGVTETDGRVVHLSQQEEKVIIDALVEQRERQEEAMGQTEQLLRRMTGSITAYMDTVGQRPLRVSDYDKTVLAIRDGEMSAFKELYPKVLAGYANELLIETAGRPGDVGQKMTLLLMVDAEQFPETAYRTACQKAIDINDPKKTAFLVEQAEIHVPDLSPSFHGEMALYAYPEHRLIAMEIIKQCTGEQIAAELSNLLELFAAVPDYEMLSKLVEKGISGGNSVAKTLHMLTYEDRNSWIAEDLLEKRMWVDVNDYRALNACVENGAVNVAKLLLDGGMDFGQYRQQFPGSGSPDTIHALEEHWNELQAQSQESAGPEQGQTQGSEIGGMDLG